MSAQIIAELANCIRGQVVLVNVHQGLSERLIDEGQVGEFLSGAAERVTSKSTGGTLTNGAFLWEIQNTVWQAPSRFQLTGPRCELPNSHVVAFKSYPAIKPLVEECDDTLPHRRLKDLTTKSYETITDDECEEVARCLNELDNSQKMPFLSIRINREETDKRFIVWLTRSEQLGGLNIHMRPNNDVATQFRNSLGLGQIGENVPLFAFVSTVSYNELIKLNGHAASRPTVFDGIDQPWFKCQRDHSYPGDDWGRATDLERVGKGVAGNLDGRPEAVFPSLPIPGNFSCVFVGRTKTKYPDPDKAYIDLLLNGRKIF